MAKLYPPYIEGTIPAFCIWSNESEATLTVPFSMNKAVSLGDFSGIAIKIKTVQNNEFVYSSTTRPSDLNYIKNTLQAKFTINLNENDKLKPGQYYKIQIAYCGTDAGRTPGYYSTVGVVKFTTRPKVTIADLQSGLSSSKLIYTGVYAQTNEDDSINMDVSEKVYEYCFNLYEVTAEEQSILVASSNWQLHNSSTDIVSYESTDQYSFTYSLKPYKYYQVEYIIRTINGLELSSGKYKIVNRVGIAPEIDGVFTHKNNFDNGYVSLTFIPNDLEHNYANGTFLLSRCSNEDNFTNWYPLLRFSLRNSDRLDQWEYKDFTVQHGMKYMYSIQQYNSKGLYSTRLYAIDDDNNKIIEPDFEDCFLYDGEKQLKIRFNPKMSSFKTDLMENKVDTIGSKYPFIFRNSRVEYKEFPIAGLISYHSDEANLFMNDEDLGLATNYTQKPRSEISRTKAFETNDLYLRARTTSLATYNIAAERIFKLAVLEWLNNGKPKLFRSPTEGNYFVRLMNVSLTPEDKTGRMIHNFQATAYEIGECNYQTLNNYGIITIDEPAEIQYRFATIDLSDPAVKAYYASTSWGEEDIIEQQTAQAHLIAQLQQQLTQAEQERQRLAQTYASNNSEANRLALLDAMEECSRLDEEIRTASAESARLASLSSYKKYNEYDIYDYIEFRDCLPGTKFWIFDSTLGEEFDIVIGVTGSYIIQNDGHIYSSIRVEEGQEPPFGLIYYKYLALEVNNFEKIYDIDYEETLIRQFIGPITIIDKRVSSDQINDIKRSLISFYYVNLKARIVEEIYKDNQGNIWQWNNTGNSLADKKGNQIDPLTLSPLMIYKIHTDLHAWEYAEWKYNSISRNYEWNSITNIDYRIIIDDNVLILEPDHEEELLNHLIESFNDQPFNYLYIGSGIVLDCAYTTSLAIYNIENTDDDLQYQMSLYTNMLEMYNEPSNEETYHSKEFFESYIIPQWQRYCTLLEEKLQE